MLFVLIGIYRVSFSKNVYEYLLVSHSLIVYNYLVNNVLGHWFDICLRTIINGHI